MSSEFVPANLLEIALRDAATDPAARPRFFKELLESKVLIVPVGENPKIVDGVIQQDTKIRLANIEINGRLCVPFFTAECRLPPGTGYLMLDARAFFEMTRGANLVMNPGAAYGKEFFPEEVGHLLDGTVFDPKERFVAKKDTQVLIGQPADYPAELVKALARLYSQKSEVRRAWLAFYHNPERDTEGGLLIALELTDPAAFDRISGESGMVIENTPKSQKYADITPYDRNGLSGYFSDKKPFYQKSVLKGLWENLTG
jgi:hypothetical protein